MATTVKGVIKNGLVEPLEPISGYEGAEVTITVPDQLGRANPAQRVYFGMFKEWGEFSEESFKAAEWRGDPDDGLDWIGS